MGNLSEKLEKYIKELQDSPSCKFEDLYLWADYAELKCIANPDGFYSRADYVNDVRPNSEDLGQGDFVEVEKMRKSNMSKADVNDKWEILGTEVFNILAVRSKVFINYYPFTVTENGHGLSLNKKFYINEKKYIFLLLSSNLGFAKDFQKELTGSFEYMCREVLRTFLPSSSVVNSLGSSNNEQEIDWKIPISKFWDKLKYLEEFLKAKLVVSENDLNKYNRGDGGIDLVGKVLVGDEESHFPIAFAQCACSPKDWIEKQADIKKDKWDQWILFKTIPQYYMFIPQNYRDSQNHWFRASNIQYTTLVDRERILNNFTKDENFQNYSSYQIVDEIIKKKERAF